MKNRSKSSGKRPKSRSHSKLLHNTRGKKRGGGKGHSRLGGRPTLILRGHTQISNTLTGVNVKQINIIPTLSVFGADILSEAKNFE